MQKLIQDLRNIASAGVDRCDMDDLVCLYSAGTAYASTYAGFQLEQPDWLKASLDALAKDIKSRRRDYLEAQLAQAKARKETLKTAEQKRADTDAEIERLSKALAE